MLRDHPEPPPGFERIALPLVELTGPLYRVHPRDFGAVYFGHPGKHDARFDIDVGVLYSALDVECAFLEVVLRDAGLGRNVRLLDRRFLESRVVSTLEFTRPLRLVDISEDGAARIGVDARISTGGDYRIAQVWARALWQHPRRPDGIYYTSRHNTRMRCAAIFRHRSHPAGTRPLDPEPEACVRERVLGTFLDRPWVQLLDKYEVGLA